MIRLIVLAALASLLCRWLLGKWPWDYLRGPSGASREVVQARRVLGLGNDADRRTIMEAHRKLVARVHPDRGGSNDQVHEANAARDLLLAQLPKERDPR